MSRSTFASGSASAPAHALSTLLLAILLLTAAGSAGAQTWGEPFAPPPPQPEATAAVNHAPAVPQGLTRAVGAQSVSDPVGDTFGAGAFEIRVYDVVSTQSKTYTNQLGHPANAVTDTRAFATCP